MTIMRQGGVLLPLVVFVTILISAPSVLGLEASAVDAATVTIDAQGEQQQQQQPEQQQQPPAAVATTMMENQNRTATTTTNEQESSEDSDNEEEEYDEDDDEEEYGDYQSPADLLEYQVDEEPGAAFGVPQDLNNVFDLPNFQPYQVQKRLAGSQQYMDEVINLQAKYKSIREQCRNRHIHCTVWAAAGECHRNAGYMNLKCGPACWSCHELLDARQDHRAPNLLEEVRKEDGPGSEFGVVQTLNPGERYEFEREHVEQKVQETNIYMGTVVWADEAYEKVHHTCENQNRHCSIWAVEGLCEDSEHFEWMTEHCAPACQRCEYLHYETRCGPMAVDPNEPVAWEKPGDLNRMFERIVATYDKVKVISRPNLLPGDEDEEAAPYLLGPWIVSLDDFLTPEEAQRWIEIGAEMGYERSTTESEVDEETGETEDEVYEERTSTNAWCERKCQQDPVSQQIFKRLEDLTGIPMVNSEQVQLLNYVKGQHYVTHHDYLEYEEEAISGPRILTVFMYLSDVEEGGETRFDYFDDKAMVKPKVGRVVLWPSVLDEDPFAIDERTDHEAMPIISGQKFAANCWFHQRDLTRGRELDC